MHILRLLIFNHIFVQLQVRYLLFNVNYYLMNLKIRILIWMSEFHGILKLSNEKYNSKVLTKISNLTNFISHK